MLNASFPAEVGVEIPSDFGEGIFWIAPNPDNNNTSHGKQNFQPRGIIIDNRDGEAGTTWCRVRGILWSEGPNDWKTRTLVCGVEHPRRYKAIDMAHTNGRGIEINA